MATSAVRMLYLKVTMNDQFMDTQHTFWVLLLAVSRDTSCTTPTSSVI